MHNKRHKKHKPKANNKVLRGVPELVDGKYEFSIDEIKSVEGGKVRLKNDRKVFKENGRQATSKEELFFIPDQFSDILTSRNTLKPATIVMKPSGLKILQDIRDGEDDGHDDL